jgi:hypothetical protein
MSGAAGPPTAIVHPQRGNRTGQCFKRRTIELNLCVKIYASKFMRQNLCVNLCVRRDWYFQNCFSKVPIPGHGRDGHR